MKKRRISALLLAACLSMPLAACGEQQGTATKTLKDYFEWGVKETVYNEVQRIDGEVIAHDEEHNLLAIERREIDPYNDGNMSHKISVVDMEQADLSNFNLDNISTIWSYSTSYSLTQDESSITQYDIEFNYPLVNVTRTYNNRVEREYYLATTNRSFYYDGDYYSNQIGGLVEVDEYGYAEAPQVDTVRGLYEISFQEKVYWADSDLSLLRIMNKDVTDGYQMFESHFFDAKDGYLYSYAFEQTTRMIQVYNKEGVCSMQYTFPSDVVMLGNGSDSDPIVLPNGNILVQEWTLAKDNDYNFSVVGTKANVTTKIIDRDSGEATEIDLNAFVVPMNEENFLPMKKAVDGSFVGLLAFNRLGMATTPEYAVIDSEGKVAYKVANTSVQLAHGDEIVQTIGNDKYIVSMVRGGDDYNEGEELLYVFDSNGEKKLMLPANTIYGDWYNDDDGYYVTEKNYVTMEGIFDYSGKCVYAFDDFYIDENVALNMGADSIRIVGNDIYAIGADFLQASKPSEEVVYDYEGNSAMKYYKFDGNKFIEVAGYDSNNIIDVQLNYSIYQDVYTKTYTLYNCNGKALLKWQDDSYVQEDSSDIYEAANGKYLWMQTEIGEKSVIYIVK